ncbi:MAG: hypothetical protein JRM97_09415 [Nitrososphaerota archaeon]|nr:hypothetical protein [Nitrososphaerota archaeon]
MPTIRLVAVAWWPHNPMSEEVETALGVEEAGRRLRKLGWVRFGDRQFNFAGSPAKGFIYDEAGWRTALSEAKAALRSGRALRTRS